MTIRLFRVRSFSSSGAFFFGLCLVGAPASLLTLSCEGLTCAELQNCEEGGAGNSSASGGYSTGGAPGSGGREHASGGAGGEKGPSSSGGEGGAAEIGGTGGGPTVEPGIELTAPDLVRVRQGEKAKLEVHVERLGGYDDELTVSLAGLPDGVVSEPIVLEGEEEDADFEIAATAEAEQTRARNLTVTVRGPDGLEEKSKLRLIVAGAPGTLDESFGNGGLLRTGASYSNVAIAEDQSIWAAGTDAEGALRLYRFDADGNANWNIEVDGRYWYDVVSQGERVIARSYDFSETNEDLLRVFNLDGSLDESFGEKGILSLEGSLDDQDRIVVAPDGGLLFANSLNTFRLNVDGTATAGFEYFYEHDSDNRPSTFAFDSKGRILGSGRINDSTRYFLNRARPDGRLDASFGMTGTAVSDTGLASDSSGQFTQAVRILVRPDDSSIFLATSNSRREDVFDIDSELAVFSFGADGSLDEGFGTDGKIVLAPIGRIFEAFRVSTGEFLVLFAPDLGSHHVLARYSDRGVLDDTLGEDGQVHLEDLLADDNEPSDRSDVAYDAVAGRVIATIPDSEYGYIASYWL